MKNQKGKLRAFKYLDSNWRSPYQGFKYEIGVIYEESEYDPDEMNCCGTGLNVATLEWCLIDCNFNLSKIFIEVEFNAKDIVAIPYQSDGKFRVKKFKIIRRVPEEELRKLIDEEVG